MASGMLDGRGLLRSLESGPALPVAPLVWKTGARAPVTSLKKGADRRGRPSHRPWRSRAQPQERLARPPARLAHRLHRACPGRASPRWPSTRSSPRASAATSSRSRRTPASSSARWTSRTSTSSRACPRPSRSTRSRPRATRARPSAPSPRSTTTCGCCSPASASRTAPSAAGPIARQSPQAIVDRVLELPEGSRFQVLSPLVRERKGEFVDLFADLQTKGYSRARVDGETIQLTEPPTLKKQEKHTIEVVIDRLTVKDTAKRRLTDSVETALGLSGGMVVLDFVDLPEDDPERERMFSEHLYCPYDDLSFEELEPRSFSFNSPFGACPDCTGIGTRMEVDPELIVPDEDKSPRRGRHPPLVARPHQGLLRPARRRARRRAGLPHRHPLRRPARSAPRRPCSTATRRRSRSATATGTAASASYTTRLRGRRPVRQAAAQRGRERRQPGALRGLHARGALPHLPGHPAQADRPRGHGHGASPSPRSPRCRSATAPTSWAS